MSLSALSHAHNKGQPYYEGVSMFSSNVSYVSMLFFKSGLALGAATPGGKLGGGGGSNFSFLLPHMRSQLPPLYSVWSLYSGCQVSPRWSGQRQGQKLAEWL